MSAGTGRIEVRGLARSFGHVVAVRPIEVEIGPASVTGLLGPNGAGKSTLMRMLLGLVPPSAGRCSIDGVALRGDGVAVRRRATYAPGEISVYGELTARRQLEWFLRGREADAIPRAVALAEELGLPLNRRVRGFSHGMKRLLSLAAALAPRVPVRILDEPTEGLDPTRRGQILERLREDAAGGTTILLSSHHLGEVDRVCDRILFLRSGELLDEQRSRTIHGEWRRAIRITWSADVSAGTVEAALGGLGTLRVEGHSAVLIPTEEDPRAALAAIAGHSELPAPSKLALGELSLQELYRELYGAEGV